MYLLILYIRTFYVEVEAEGRAGGGWLGRRKEIHSGARHPDAATYRLPAGRERVWRVFYSASRKQKSKLPPGPGH
jgi:hypothetical protein